VLYILHLFFGEEAEVSGPERFYEGGLILKVGLGWVRFLRWDFFGFFGLGGFIWMDLDGAMITLAVGGLLFRRGGWERGFGGGWVGGGGEGGERDGGDGREGG